MSSSGSSSVVGRGHHHHHAGIVKNNDDIMKESEWNSVTAIKWLLIALVLSISSVFLFDLIISFFSTKISKSINSGSGIDISSSIMESEIIFSEFDFTKHSKGKPLTSELNEWLQENLLQDYSELLQKLGVVTLVSVVQLDHLTQDTNVDWSPKPNNNQPEQSTEELRQTQSGGVRNPSSIQLSSTRALSLAIPKQDRERLRRAATILRQRLILRLWLDDHGLLEFGTKFNGLGVNSIEDAYWFEDLARLGNTIGEKIVPMWISAQQSLPTGLASLETLKESLWNRLVHLDQQSIWNTWGTMLLVTLSVTGFGAIASYFPQMLDAKQAILQYVSGKFSLASNCQVEFDWEDPVPVGQTVSMNIRFFQRGGRPYPICDKDNLIVEVKKDSQKIAVVMEFGGKEPTDANLVVVKFSVRRSGQYTIHVLAENSHVRGSPFNKTFLPGPIDPLKTLFLKQTSTVCVTGAPHKLIIEPRDIYGNCCRQQDFHIENFRFVTRMVGSNDESPSVHNCSIQFALDISHPTGNTVTPPVSSTTSDSGRVALTTRFSEPGVFSGTLTYNNKTIQNGCFEILALDQIEAAAVQKNVALKTPNIYYEGKVVSIGKDVSTKARKVYVTVSAKQLVIKEYFLKLLPIRVATFRLSPHTKLQFMEINNQNGQPTILIDDGSQPPVKLSMKDAKIVVATFTHFLLRNIGGSETFQDKQEYFFKELRDFHRKHSRDKVTLKILRENIIESTWKATRSLSTLDWCRNFDISFVGEQGIDWGGLRREWFEQICSKLFESGNPVGMFASFPESRLVHPNPNSRWKSKHYEMAGRIVGKCLFESSLGSSYRQMVKAKFTRSFLAQLIGLRINYKYFEQDDPELFLRKVKFILENDVECMELTFTEEEYDPMGKLLKIVDLIPDGSKTIVTNENKKEYLNALAQYRLSAKVKSEVDAFLKGLNEVVPDELLTIFDENELELLMCGTSEYSVTELREHHVVCGGSGDFRRVLDWFWTCVGNMTEEEKARLLQFTTGCSLLPPGGFKELSPLFQITLSPTFGNLPTAHTCFNQLCLPDYDSYESFEKSLRIAVNEGSEGFGLI